MFDKLLHATCFLGLQIPMICNYCNSSVSAVICHTSIISVLTKLECIFHTFYLDELTSDL